ncbi:MAG: signal peptidase I [Candidatus Staskawiczbacteria bacterium RIFOXYB2_FULL_32_9]|uniref:Signal peptidase I n=1 Tax=Candidatus Staskawiczbacteria bacterium RIFOXYD1_FULL_32_13 TaxID=1802234 RepID=A0A1G2JPU6_9BACT|nr:MAG: Signal peptidase I [Parcubacteria group bacterium GW2011_GWC2_32_10]OGZ78099.1 MAG: signal peptidase I [Candidatus Staskawiczbacteria bacterium RIFOXYA2_FULL_32_7]OGZ79452.1 MAG: signal peptidase I [Candidatus Staskawiczbacteria bacterium RIFOXYB1_FULL_32_11]OGZ83159.1 MAG: signal peptidase I [Candidatus Staskawiczbacteria bacterium RIFOXYB2_FULL_32_9]OGZ87233.1 MAG: signal peptidase I [Candidatus Staskawiczbacteria bacterium RIFOXYC2_FULL_32_10]OGZ89102.1 MAG: signal peptidase I [Cand
MAEENLNNSSENKQDKKSFWQGFLSSAWEIVKIVVIASVIVLPIRYFLFQPFIVKGESMMPNYQDGNYLIIDEISYRFIEPKRGDVIVFKTEFIAGYKNDRFIKRIMALPGETIEIKNNKVTITKGEEVLNINENKYLPGVETIGDIKKTLGNDEYFVMGDNREHSFDSRIWGSLPKKDIVGKVFLRLLPIDKLELATTPIY